MAKVKASSELARYLQTARSLGTSKDGASLSLFQAFNLTGFDLKGQITTGFGERGTRISLNVSWDFGDLILPGVVTANLSAGVGGQSSGYALTFVARHPQAIKNKAGKTVYTSMRPICFGHLRGYARELNASASVQLGASAVLGPDELGLEAKIGAGARVGGRWIRLLDAGPRYYASSSDSALSTDFALELDVLTRHQLKNMLHAWLEEQEAWVEKLQASDQASDALVELRQAYADGQDFYSTCLPTGDDSQSFTPTALPSDAATLSAAAAKLSAAAAKLSSSAAAKLNSAAAKLKSNTDNLSAAKAKLNAAAARTNFSISGLVDGVAGYLFPPKTARLKEDLESLERLLKKLLAPLAALEASLTKKGESLEESDAERKDALEEQIRRLTDYRAELNVIEALKTAKNTAAVPAKASQTAWLAPPSNRTCLNLFAVDGGAAVSASASVSASAFGASTSVDASARANMITFRFQTEGSGSAPLVITEDTVLQYRELNANALATLSYKGKPKEANAEMKYRSMIYHSAVVYWKPRGKSVDPLTGSGLRFGFGINVGVLIQIANSLAASPKPADGPDLANLIARITHHLRITKDRLQTFLDECDIAKDDPDQYTVDVLLLESGFAFPSDFSGLEATAKNGVYELDDTLAAMSGPMASSATLANSNLTLDVLRLRYRLSDQWDRGDSMFRIGFTFVAGADFSVDKIKTGGHEGILDRYTWFADEDSEGVSAKGYESTVPAVALLHH